VSILALVAETMFNHCRRKSKVFDTTLNVINKNRTLRQITKV